MKGPGLWKLNNSLVEEEGFKNIIRNTIKKIEVMQYGSTSKKWEKVKAECKKVSIEYAKNRSRAKNYLLYYNNMEVNKLNKEMLNEKER